MICDKPGVVYAEGDDGMLLLGCSACDWDIALGEVALVREIAAAERQHHTREIGTAELGRGND